MPVWVVGEEDPEDIPDASCGVCLADLPDQEPHKPWCPERKS